ncbi:MAG TPA: FUSC family membrane protein, partial [Flavobacterium sp.]|nr:FUSC family membrane protein [Flavobacterium sp.]
MFEEIRKFTDSTNFSNAIKVTIAALVPFVIFNYLDMIAVGFSMAIGSFLTYPSDIPSNLKHKIVGIIVAAAIVAGCNLVVNVLHPFPYILYPIVALLLFFLSMISVYGHRANMVSFSGLLAVALAFGHLQKGWDIFLHSAIMFGGGIFYLIVSLLFHYIRPHRYTALQISDCIRLTSKYLKLRGDLWDGDADRAKIVEKQLNLQVELNQIHENIREILIRNRPESGHSEQDRKMLLVFISLVDIMELALSTSFDHSKLHAKFSNYPNVLQTYQNLAYNLSSTLKQIARAIQNSQNYIPKHKLAKNLRKLNAAIREYESVLGKENAEEGVWMLSNMYHYAENQIEKIRIIERAFAAKPDLRALRGRDKDLEKFLTPVYYPWATLRENLNFSSTIFRHSLRLTITFLASFIIAWFFPLQNIYWILLTIVVIMRPGYGLTKERVLQRIIGTIVGGLIAFAFLDAIDNTMVIGILAVITMVLGFAFTAIDYKVGVAFVTMYVVFLYGILTPN